MLIKIRICWFNFEFEYSTGGAVEFFRLFNGYSDSELNITKKGHYAT